MTRLTLLATTLVACDVDPLNCNLFSPESCTPRDPAGRLCGLAHQLDRHLGASCATLTGVAHDPAANSVNGVWYGTAIPGQEDACPNGHSRFDLPDHESDQSWSTCATGGVDTARVHWEDVPAGAVCGMASLDQERQTPCMGHDVLVDGCPVGTTLRIVADEWRDLLDEDLEQLCSVNSECEGLDGLAQRGWDLTAFCEVDADVGCLDCPAWSLRPGTICGLHGRFNMSLLSDPPDVRAGDDAVLADLRRIGEFVDARLRIGFRESLVQADRNHGPLVERLLQPAQCLGVDVTMHGCPPPLRMTCSSDLLNGEPWRLSPTPDPLGADLLAPAINRAGLCWCDLPTAQQVWKEVLITADAALDDQGRLVLSAERTGGFRSDGRLGDVRFELRFTQGSLEASGTPTADHPGSTAELRRAELSAVPTWNVIVSTDPFPQGPVRVRLPVTLTAQEARVVVQVRDAAVDDGSFVNLGLLNEVVLRP